MTPRRPDRYDASVATLLAIRWTEAQGKAALWQRAGHAPGQTGRCEGCGAPGGVDFAHRVRRSQGGTWSPVNALALCRRCHDRADNNPDWAKSIAWELHPSEDPADIPVWMIHVEWGPGLYRLGIFHDGEGIRRHHVELLAVPAGGVAWWAA